MVRELQGKSPKGRRVDTELGEELSDAFEGIEVTMRTGAIAARDIDYTNTAYSAGWLSADGNAGSIFYALDEDVATYIDNITANNPKTMTIELKGVRLISRIAMKGIFRNTTIQVYDLNAQAYVTVLNQAADAALRNSIDSGNFPLGPIFTDDILLTFASAAQIRISEMGVLEVTEVKNGQGSSPGNPMFIQAQQQIVNTEATVTVPGGMVGAGTNVLDKDTSTSVVGTGILVITLSHPKIIGSIAIDGNLDDVDIDVTTTDGNTIAIDAAVTNVDGYVSSNFGPVTVDSVTITANNASTINEVAIYKIIVTNPTTSPADPLQVQAEQQIVRGETSSIAGTGNVTNAHNVMDKDITTSAVIANPAAGAESITITLTHPILINRIGLSGFLDDISITVVDIGGNLITVLSERDSATGVDTDIFGPIYATYVIIGQAATAAAGGSTINEIVIQKAINVQPSTTYGDPLPVQAEQQIVRNEVSTVVPSAGFTGVPFDLFDKGEGATFVTLPPGAGSISVLFTHPILVGRVSISGGGGGGSLDTISVSVVSPDSILTEVISEQTGDFLDSNNFASRFISGLSITQGAASGGSSFQEIVVLKVIETKPTTSPAYPLHVQAEQQIARGEIAGLVASAGVTDAPNITDKDATTTAVLAATAQTITVTLTHPILISRVLVTGALDDISVSVSGSSGNTVVVIAEADSGDGLDSGNFTPMYADALVISQGAGSAGSTIQELIVQKVIETKSYSEQVLPELVTAYGQWTYFDPLETGAGPTSRNYLLMRRPLEVDTSDDPSQDPDRTTSSFASTDVDAQRITVDFHVPHDDLRIVRHIAQGQVTVEASSNCVLSSVRYTLGYRNLSTDAFTVILGPESIGEVGGAGTPIMAAGPGVRHVDYVGQGWLPTVIPDGSVFVLRVEVWGYQVAVSATPSIVTLWHSRGSADVKIVVEVVRQSSGV